MVTDGRATVSLELRLVQPGIASRDGLGDCGNAGTDELDGAGHADSLMVLLGIHSQWATLKWALWALF